LQVATNIQHTVRYTELASTKFQGLWVDCSILTFIVDLPRKKSLSRMNIRLNHQQRDAIDRAASYLGKNRSDLVLEVACREAEHVLLDRVYIAVGEETFANLCQLLDSPPEPSEGLRKLIRMKAPWA
jgi:uncharacterized protein (DUF1778 family)